MTTSLSNSEARGLGPAAWPLLTIILLMLVISIASVQVVSWTRAYAGGLAIWVASENRASFELDEYQESGEEAAYQRFRRELAVPLALGRARMMLLGGRPDLALVRRSFLAGHIPQEDVAGLIHMFRLFRHHPYMMRAIDIWTEADGYVQELDRIGAQLHAEYARARPDPMLIAELAAQADGAQARIVPLAMDFGLSVGKAGRQIVALLMIVMPLIAALMVVIGVVVFRVHGRRAGRAAQELRELTARFEHQAHA